MGNAAETVDRKAERMRESSGRKGISGSTLKLIAIITMFIDHTGAIVLERMLVYQQQSQTGVMLANVSLYYTYLALRLIGRMGFPIFCYLLIEGFRHTRSVKKYAGRLLLFALVSEIPFDLGFAGTPFYWEYQNVFFTLFLGLLVIAGFHFVEEKKEWNIVFRILLIALILAVGAAAAELLRTDYGAAGVLTIAVMYLFRKNKMAETALGCTALTLTQGLVEITSFFILPSVYMYNGRRGWNIKWFFYAFYPLHILLLYLIACAMGLGQVMLRI